ncbi:MAG: sugar phosphate isomerase/epimerase [Methanomicrobium sp.]|nr:sugar phosphate isomerase/epimerase [Methanomicrobium sp.]
MSAADSKTPAPEPDRASRNGKRPKYSVSTMFFHEYTLEDILRSALGAGCDSVEFWLETPTFWVNEMPKDYMSNPDTAADRYLKELFGSFPELSPITVHTPVLDLNPCSVNPDVARVSTLWARRALITAHNLGAEVLTLHPGRRTAKRQPGGYDYLNLCRFLDSVDAAGKELKAKNGAGNAGVMVAIENMQPAINALLTTPEQMKYFLDGGVDGYFNNYECEAKPDDIAFRYLKMKERLPVKDDRGFKNEPLYFTFDISHALADNGAKAADDAIRYIDMYFDKIVNVHAGGAESGRVHLPVSQSPAAREVLKYLADCGYTRHVTLEIDDLNLGKTLDLKEKKEFIAGEVGLLKAIFEG